MATKLPAGMLHNEGDVRDVPTVARKLQPGDEVRWFGGMFDTVTVTDVEREMQYDFYRVKVDSGHDLRHLRGDSHFWLAHEGVQA